MKHTVSNHIYYVFIFTAATLLLTGCDAAGSSGMASSSSSKKTAPVIVMDEEKDEPVIKSDPEEIAEALPEKETVSENGFHGYILTEEEKNDPRVRCIETASENTVVMDFAGDINFDERYSNMNTYKACGSAMAGVLSENLLSELNSADIFMINNEFPYSDRGTPTPNKTFTFRARPSMVGNLQEMGADIVGLANNHAYDHGAEALLDTFDTLEGAGIPYVGAGRNLDEACEPFYFVAGGMKIAFVAATQIERTDPPDTREATADSPGVLRTLDATKFLKVIKAADEAADLTVVFVHWGTENKYEIDASQRELAKQYAASGADLIIGAHSHCLQGFEYVDDVPIIYSMGNFWFSSKDLDSCVIQAVARDKKIESVRFLPCVQHNCRTDLYEKGSGEYERLLGVMAGLSYDVSIDEDGCISKGSGRGVSPREPKPLKQVTY